MDLTVAPQVSLSDVDRALVLPPDFRWGAATAAYQIEGAAWDDGRTACIWDTFARTPGKVHNGDNGDVACDHYHRMPADVALMASLGLDTYRFSVAWPRIQPGGHGPINETGMGFYDRLVDELLHHGIDPWVTVYHWDLPQELEDAGGWPVRDTAYRYAEMALAVFERLGDRVSSWTTINEPWCVSILGYTEGRHAPGRRSYGDGIAAAHHLLLGHGLAVQGMRAAGPRPIELGITLNLGTAHPETDTERDREAARRADGIGARLFLDPLVHGRYPVDVIDDLAARDVMIPVQDGDLEIISTPIDTLGVNYYTSFLFSGLDPNGRTHDDDGVIVTRPVVRGLPHTAMGPDWEIIPEEFTELLVRIARDYPGLPMVITENGAAFEDAVETDGTVLDTDRRDYIAAHLGAVAAARARGADIRGYLVWSLMDNFEWAYGYEKRFGIVRVDYQTQERTPKLSARWFRDTAIRMRSGSR